VLIFHYALPSLLTQAFCEQRSRRVLLHHNITPAEFFEAWDPELVRICALGRRELGRLAGETDLALADSEFNRQELAALGFPRTGVLPILLDFARYRERPNPVLKRLLSDGRTNILFVGRLAPNKRQEDVIRLASYWKRFISADLRVVLVGKPPRRHHYFDALQSFAYGEGFTASEVVFTGHVDHDDLLATYAAAHVFVSMSEHEGFGVPLVESMLMRVPVLAYSAAAVPHTLGPAGVRFSDKSRLAEVAEMAHLLATDPALRESVLRGQDARLSAFRAETVQSALRAYLDSL
jgi:L-malate glycosyltransferase